MFSVVTFEEIFFCNAGACLAGWSVLGSVGGPTRQVCRGSAAGGADPVNIYACARLELVIKYNLNKRKKEQ